MTRYKHAKRTLIGAGYRMKKSTGKGAVWLTKDDNDIVLWIDEDSYGYVFFHKNLNVSVHKKGQSFWATDRNHNYVDSKLGDYFDVPESVLEDGRHVGHHVKTLEEVTKVFFN